MDNKIKFIGGLFPHPTNSSWVKSNIGIKYHDFKKELESLEQYIDEKGYLNICLCESKNGKQYFKLDEYKQKKEVTAQQHNPDRDLPF